MRVKDVAVIAVLWWLSAYGTEVVISYGEEQPQPVTVEGEPLNY